MGTEPNEAELRALAQGVVKTANAQLEYAREILGRIPAADLPDRSVVATATKAWIKTHPTPTAPWCGAGGGYHGDWAVQEALDSGEATVLRVGDGT